MAQRSGMWNEHDPSYFTNGGILSNGYQLQHYKPVPPEPDELHELYQWLKTASEPEFLSNVQWAKQVVNSPQYQQFLQFMQMYPQPTFTKMSGLEDPPMREELLAKGSRGYAIWKIEDYWKKKCDFWERIDPGGRKEERELELQDRRVTEEKKKRRDKRARRAEGSACILQ